MAMTLIHSCNSNLFRCCDCKSKHTCKSNPTLHPSPNPRIATGVDDEVTVRSALELRKLHDELRSGPIVANDEVNEVHGVHAVVREGRCVTNTTSQMVHATNCANHTVDRVNQSKTVNRGNRGNRGSKCIDIQKEISKIQKTLKKIDGEGTQLQAVATQARQEQRPATAGNSSRG